MELLPGLAGRTGEGSTLTPPRNLYEALLGNRKSVQEVLDEAGREIGQIFTNRRTEHKVRRENGVSFVRMYDFKDKK